MAIRQLYIFIMVSCVSDYEASQATALEIVNVALGKPARISSTFEGSGPASLAVDGNTNTTYASVFSGHPNCIHTANGDENAWWEVDLGRNYTVTNITVYIRDIYPEMINNVVITVDGKQCYTFPQETPRNPPDKNVSCTTPTQGRIVRFSKFSVNNMIYYMMFCEVQIWGCTTGYYGVNCKQKCGRCDVNSICDSTTGHCLDGCQAGWKEPMCFECVAGKYGDNCNQSCGKCKKGTICNASNGVCLEGCQDGFEEPLCNEACRNHTYGPNCGLQCGRCNNSAPCDAVTGNCISCETNFQLPKCIVLDSTEFQVFSSSTTIHCYLTGVVAGSFGAGLLIGGAIVAAVLIWLRRSTLKEKTCPQPSPEDREAHDTSKDYIAMENSNLYENTYGKLETQEDVTKPYEKLGK